MAQSTAYYEGLQYGENKIPDFGGAAIKGVDRMIQLQEDERRRQEKELQFRMKMIQDNPEVAYASFENSGIKNIDTYNTKVAELVKNKFNDLNLKYQEDGDKTAYVMGVSKLKGEVMNYTTHVKPMIEYGQKITELGENASAVMYDNVERIDGAMQYGVPSMSPDGTLSNVSIVPQDDGSFKQDKIAFGEMQTLTNIHQRQDKFGLATDAVKAFGEDSRFVDDKGRVVLSTLLTKDGKMQSSAERIIRADVSALGRSSLVDIADQFGIQAQYGSNGELLNRKELVDGVADAEIEYATSLIQEKQTEDEFAYENFDRRLKYNASKRYGSKDVKYRIRQFEDGSAVLNMEKPLTIQSIAGIAVQENQSATETEKIFDDMYGPGGSGETTDPSQKYFNLSVNYVRISPTGRSVVLNANYIPEINEEYIKASGERAVRKKRGREQRGDIMMPIESIEAQRLLDQMGLLDEHRNVLANPVRVTGRRAYGAPTGRASQFNTFNK